MLPVLRRNQWLSGNFDDTFARLRGEMDSLLGHDGGFLAQAASGVPVSVWEDEDHYYLEADLPGVQESDVEVTIHQGLLHVRGERKPAENVKYLYNGRGFGRFERVVQLPAQVSSENVEATMSGGVLRLRLAKSADAKPRRITIQKS
ncbi:MAG: Hsp20/alpha crystallin family protein [Isosphaeraceae bacterium]